MAAASVVVGCYKRDLLIDMSADRKYFVRSTLSTDRISVGMICRSSLPADKLACVNCAKNWMLVCWW